MINHIVVKFEDSRLLLKIEIFTVSPEAFSKKKRKGVIA